MHEARCLALAVGPGAGVLVASSDRAGCRSLWLMLLPLGGNPRTPTLWQAMIATAHQTNGALLAGGVGRA